MTQKQIEIEAQNYLNSLDLPENADKQLIVDNFKNGMAWALLMFDEEKQKLIDEACEWLAKNDSYATPTNVQVDRLRERLNNI